MQCNLFTLLNNHEIQDKLRRDEDDQYYLLENGVIRKIPDDETLKALHVKKDQTLVGEEIIIVPLLTDEEKELHSFGPPFPSRKDGTLIKGSKNRNVYYLFNGHKHLIWDMSVFLGMGKSFDEVKTMPDSDIEQIFQGPPIRSVEQYHKMIGSKSEDLKKASL